MPHLTSCQLDFLNQACVGRRLACAWFLKIDPVQIVGMDVCVCVCPRPRLLITSGVIWHDVNLIRLVKQVLQLLYGNVLIMMLLKSGMLMMLVLVAD